MPEWASTIIVVLVLLLILFGMWQGWRALVRRSAHLEPSHDMPAGLGEPLVEARVLYVATTAQGRPLERLAITGLGFRAQGVLTVHGSGLVVSLDGAEDVWIPASSIDSAQPAQVVIDKAVEKDGLVVVTWGLHSLRESTGETVLVDSYFRVLEPEKTGSLYNAIDSLTAQESEV
ncbi:hypothetical protein GCM10022286_04130 [Gryllotalpicola daejeonensis]|uniref:PH domain-containing protein n=1 Tax=Gryllotalpicola daejeonensis TaxID=993087 RepID=A0ABP7ZES7_9MICO